MGKAAAALHHGVVRQQVAVQVERIFCHRGGGRFGGGFGRWGGFWRRFDVGFVKAKVIAGCRFNWLGRGVQRVVGVKLAAHFQRLHPQRAGLAHSVQQAGGLGVELVHQRHGVVHLEQLQAQFVAIRGFVQRVQQYGFCLSQLVVFDQAVGHDQWIFVVAVSRSRSGGGLGAGGQTVGFGGFFCCFFFGFFAPGRHQLLPPAAEGVFATVRVQHAGQQGAGQAQPAQQEHGVMLAFAGTGLSA